MPSSNPSSPIFPGLYTWKKDCNSIFCDIDPNFSSMLGFKKAHDAIGKSDDEIPCAYAEYADHFRQSDQSVLKQNETIHFLEIQQIASREWKTFYVVKAPYYINNELYGTAGYCIDITTACFAMSQLLLHPEVNKKTSSAKKFFTFEDQRLSPRESETLFFLLKGQSYKKIALLLSISPRTVEQYIENMKIKFNCQNKSELMESAIQFGYLEHIPKSLLKKQMILVLKN